MSSIKLNLPSQVFENASSQPAYRRSGQLKSTFTSLHSSQNQSKVAPVMQALNERRINIDGVLAFPINWSGYLNKENGFLTKENLQISGPRRLNTQSSSSFSSIPSLKSTSSSSSSSSSSGSSSDINEYSPSTPDFDFEEHSYSNMDMERYCSLSDIEMTPPTPTLHTIPLPSSSFPQSANSHKKQKRYTKPDSLFFINTLNF